MLFPSTEFLVFFALLLLILAACRNTSTKKIVLLVASYIFYMWWNPAFILLIVFSTAVDFVVGERLGRTDQPSNRRALLFISIAANLGLLGVFKYAGFLQENAFLFARALGIEPGWTTVHVILPVGISFYTFQTMSYSIDVYRRVIPPTRSAIDFALFVSFFPQLVAGPIVRAADFIPQLETEFKFNFDSVAVLQILRGLLKKIVIADNLALFVDSVYSSPETWPSTIVWLATISFAVQIYCDFSGYSDMAIGIAKIIGFEFPQNFSWPYFARGPSDFWQRWHISLSSWLRDYLYIPLGGNRHGEIITHRNLMATMLLGGLWHGASWNFVVWGGLHGAALCLCRLATRLTPRFTTSLFQRLPMVLLGWLGFQLFVLITWVPFRATGIDAMSDALLKCVVFDFDLGLKNIGLGAIGLFSTIAILGAFVVLHAFSFRHGGIDRRLARASDWVLTVSCFLSGAVLLLFWPANEVPFVYFQF